MTNVYSAVQRIRRDRAEISLVIDLGVGPVAFPNLYGAFLRPGDQHRPSLKLLDQIRVKITSDNVVYCQGLAEALPFRDRQSVRDARQTCRPQHRPDTRVDCSPASRKFHKP